MNGSSAEMKSNLFLSQKHGNARKDVTHASGSWVWKRSGQQTSVSLFTLDERK